MTVSVCQAPSWWLSWVWCQAFLIWPCVLPTKHTYTYTTPPNLPRNLMDNTTVSHVSASCYVSGTMLSVWNGLRHPMFTMILWSKGILFLLRLREAKKCAQRCIAGRQPSRLGTYTLTPVMKRAWKFSDPPWGNFGFQILKENLVNGEVTKQHTGGGKICFLLISVTDEKTRVRTRVSSL